VLSKIGILLILAVASLQAKELLLSKNLTSISPVVQAPSLKLNSLEDNMVNIKDFKGKVVIVNFWATWCPPCRAELPSLSRMYEKYKSKNIVVLAVNIGEDAGTAFSYLNNLEPSPSFPVLLDTDTKTMRRWGVVGIPTTFIINKKGQIVYKAIGGRDFDDKNLVNKITELTK
jgi:thiol-disulfide isomerase/thioredoxin